MNAPFFVGFTPKYPDYEIITPQDLLTFKVRSLTVADESTLKSSLVNPRKLPEHINKVLWSCITYKPDHIKSIDDFINMVTIKDREALLYGLYHITYKDVNNYDTQCPSCQNTYGVSFKLSEIFKMNAYKGQAKELSIKRIPVKLDCIEEDVEVVIRQPNLKHEQELTNDFLFQTDQNLELGTSMLIIDSFTVKNGDGSSLDVTTREDIFSAYTQLPSQDKNKLNKVYIDNFGKYSIELKMNSTCPRCSHNYDMDIDLMRQLFRSMYQ